MQRRTRNILFFFFLIGFLVAAPLVIGYTAGYRIHFASGSIVRTGVISLSSVPRGARISLDGTQLSERTPHVEPNVLPGPHTITLSLPNFFSWEKELEVSSQSTAFADGTQLWYDQPATLERQVPLSLVFPHPEKHIALYAVDTAETREWWLLTGEGTHTLALRQTTLGEQTVSWSVHGTYALIQTEDEASVLLNTERGIPIETSLTQEALAHAIWDTQFEDRLYIQDDDGLFDLYTVRDEKYTPLSIPADQIQSVDDHVLTLEHVDGTTVVAKKDVKTGTADILAYLPDGTYTFHPATYQRALIQDLGRDRLILLDTTGVNQPILFNEPATTWAWSRTKSHLLMTDGFELHEYNLSTHRRTTLTRIGSKIHQVYWHPTGQIMFYQTDETIVGIERDGRDYRQRWTFVDQPGTAFLIDEAGDQLLMLSTQTENAGSYLRLLRP